MLFLNYKKYGYITILLANHCQKLPFLSIHKIIFRMKIYLRHYQKNACSEQYQLNEHLKRLLIKVSVIILLSLHLRDLVCITDTTLTRQNITISSQQFKNRTLSQTRAETSKDIIGVRFYLQLQGLCKSMKLTPQHGNEGDKTVH